ncbi:hypothetical protein [Mumia zhuanghuii]|nr:hypothetical protein [Mumia zhuanghuii]
MTKPKDAPQGMLRRRGDCEWHQEDQDDREQRLNAPSAQQHEH